MKLSRTKIAKLLKSGNQSRKHIRSKTFDNKAFKDDELILSTNASHSKSIGHRVAGKKQRTAHAGKRHVNLRLKTMKNAAWNKKHFAEAKQQDHINQQGGKVPNGARYKYVKAILAFKDGLKEGDDVNAINTKIAGLKTKVDLITTTPEDPLKEKFTKFEAAAKVITNKLDEGHKASTGDKAFADSKQTEAAAQAALDKAIQEAKAKAAKETTEATASTLQTQTDQDKLNADIKAAEEAVDTAAKATGTSASDPYPEVTKAAKALADAKANC